MGGNGTKDIIAFGIARAISARRALDVTTARLIAVELDRTDTYHPALSEFVHDGVVADALVSELIQLDLRSEPDADDRQRWACWLASYVAAAVRPLADGDAFFAFLALQPAQPSDDLYRGFTGAYRGSFTDEALVRAAIADDPDLERHDVVPLFGRFHVFAR
ncbi:hypothetical protein [Nocardia wallacei]|uniref:Uncharacterized protein n=1 Tax=Nocardia wallacei TaxID=480035 RepID=A0A7G1KRT0_9NOCA|nr:hypothetical protein [Nocardia wallacei]BCK57860.1 hypothetical protein NWFMUON74_56320 [Nocardia wallacei]